MKNIHVQRIQTLPVEDVTRLVRESEEQGFDFLDRLIDNYENGSNRFDQPGEGLFGVYDGETLIAIGGLNCDPFLFDPFVGRVRRVYVASAYRRQGVGKMLLEAIISAAKGHFKLLTLRADTPDAAALYEGLGFQTEPRIENATHHLQLTPTLYFPAPVIRYAS